MEENATALLEAASVGNLEMLKYLVEIYGAEINIVDKIGRFPLSVANGYGHLKVEQYLNEHGAIPSG